MGVQTHILIARVGDAQSMADSESPTDTWDGFTFNGFDRVQLCTLLSLLRSGNWDTHFDHYLDAIDVIPSSIDDWPVVSIVNAKEVAELAAVGALEEHEFQSLATKWTATEEFAGWSAAEVQELLRELGDLAESASLQGKCVMLWQNP